MKKREESNFALSTLARLTRDANILSSSLVRRCPRPAETLNLRRTQTVPVEIDKRQNCHQLTTREFLSQARAISSITLSSIHFSHLWFPRSGIGLDAYRPSTLAHVGRAIRCVRRPSERRDHLLKSCDPTTRSALHRDRPWSPPMQAIY